MLIQSDYGITSDTSRKEKKCRCQNRNLQIFFVFSIWLCICIFDENCFWYAATNSTDLWHLLSAKTLLVHPRTAESLFQFSFAEDTVHLYHFLGPFADSQRSTHI